MCTIAEVLDWNGQWTRELVELMLPVAWERENAAERSSAKAVAAGIGAAFSKKGWAAIEPAFKAFEDGIRKVQVMARGGKAKPEESAGDVAFKTLADAFTAAAKKSPAVRRKR